MKKREKWVVIAIFSLIAMIFGMGAWFASNAWLGDKDGTSFSVTLATIQVDCDTNESLKKTVWVALKNQEILSEDVTFSVASNSAEFYFRVGVFVKESSASVQTMSAGSGKDNQTAKDIIKFQNFVPTENAGYSWVRDGEWYYLYNSDGKTPAILSRLNSTTAFGFMKKDSFVIPERMHEGAYVQDAAIDIELKFESVQARNVDASSIENLSKSFTTQNPNPTDYSVNFYDTDGKTIKSAQKVKSYAGDVTPPTKNPTKTGYSFVAWNTCEDGLGADVAVWNGSAFVGDEFSNITQSLDLYPRFVSNDVTVKVDYDDTQGSILYDGKKLAKGGTISVGFGSSPTFVIKAETGYEISSIKRGTTSITITDSKEQEVVLTSVAAETTLSVTFKQKQYEISVVSTGKGTTTLTVDGQAHTNTKKLVVAYGKNVTLSVKPDTSAGSIISSLKIDGVDENLTDSQKASGYSYTFKNIAEDHSVEVVYIIRMCEVTVTGDNFGTVSPSGTFSVKYGSSQKIVASAYAGCCVSSITVNGEKVFSDNGSELTSTSYTLSNITKNTTVVVAFKQLWSVSGSNITKYNGSKTDITIPATVYNGASNVAITGVTGIGKTDLTKVTFSSGIKTIGNDVFKGCTKLSTVTLPATLTSIGNSAFSGCTALKNISLPTTLATIGSSAFQNCTGLSTITFPASVEKINESAFNGCTSLSKITFNGTTAPTTVGSDAFTGHNSSSMTLSVEASDKANYINNLSNTGFADGVYMLDKNSTKLAKSVSGVFKEIFFVTLSNGANGTATVANGSHEVYKDGQFSVTFTAKTNYVISSIKVDGKDLEKIDETIVKGSTQITWSKKITANCTVQSTYISQQHTVTVKISGYGEVSPESQEVSHGNSLTINAKAFAGSCVSSITVDGTEKFSDDGSEPTSKSYTLSSIQKDTTVVVTFKQLWSVSDSNITAYLGSKTDITVPATVYDGSKDVAITGVKSIGKTNLTSVKFSEGITTICDSVFSGYTSLKTVVLSSSITKIGSSAFSGCTSLSSINLAIASGLTSIGDSAFSCCTALKSISLPKSLTEIGASAFYRCTSLSTVTLPTSLKSIGNSAFSGCTGFTTITFPASVTSIGESAFSDCTKLAKITFQGATAPTIGGTTTFNGVDSECEIYIPNGSLDSYAPLKNGGLHNTGFSSGIDPFLTSYTAVEYIQSSGSQYIDTGIYANATTAIEIDFQFTEVSTKQQRTFGPTHDSDTGSNVSFGSYINGGGNWAYAYKDGTGNWLNSGIAATTDRTQILLDGKNKIFKVTINNAVKYNSALNGSVTRTSNEPLSLFADATTTRGGATNRAKLKCYSVKIWQNGTLVRDYVPCIRNVDGVAGMYDKVENKFYTNAGTGAFTTGAVNNDIVDEYQRLEYIQSTGTQYINTGYYWRSDNVRVILSANVTNQVAGQSLFGNEEYLGSDRYFALIPHNSGGTPTLFTLDRKLITYSYTQGVDMIYDVESIANGQNKTITLNITQNGTTTTFGGQTYNTEGSLITNPNKLENGVGLIYLFASHNSGRGAVDGSATPNLNAQQFVGGMKLYSFKMYDNGTLVRSFVPVKRMSDGAVGLFDLVEYKFYANAGTGSFTAGAVSTSTTCATMYNTSKDKIAKDKIAEDVDNIFKRNFTMTMTSQTVPCDGKSHTIEINEALPTATAGTSPSVTYTYVKYDVENSSYIESGTGNSFTTPGIYEVTATFSGGTFYLATASVTATLTITTNDLTNLVTFDDDSTSYDGLPHTITATAKDSSNTFTFSYSIVGLNGESTNAAGLTAEYGNNNGYAYQVGDYIVTATVTNDGSLGGAYIGSPISAKLHITRAELKTYLSNNVTVSNVTTKYTGSAQGISLKNAKETQNWAGSDGVEVPTPTIKTGTTTVTSPIDAGEYVYTWKIYAGRNYSGIYGGKGSDSYCTLSATLTIEKATLNNKPQFVVYGGKFTGGSWPYAINNVQEEVESITVNVRDKDGKIQSMLVEIDRSNDSVSITSNSTTQESQKSTIIEGLAAEKFNGTVLTLYVTFKAEGKYTFYGTYACSKNFYGGDISAVTIDITENDYSFTTNQVTAYSGMTFINKLDKGNDTSAVTYKSSNTEAATVNSDGKVTITSDVCNRTQLVRITATIGEHECSYYITLLPYAISGSTITLYTSTVGNDGTSNSKNIRYPSTVTYSTVSDGYVAASTTEITITTLGDGTKAAVDTGKTYETITISDKITTIKANAFLNCTTATSLIFKSAVSSINSTSLQGMTGLKTIQLTSAFSTSYTLSNIASTWVWRYKSSAASTSTYYGTSAATALEEKGYYYNVAENAVSVKIGSNTPKWYDSLSSAWSSFYNKTATVKIYANQTLSAALSRNSITGTVTIASKGYNYEVIVSYKDTSGSNPMFTISGSSAKLILNDYYLKLKGASTNYYTAPFVKTVSSGTFELVSGTLTSNRAGQYSALNYPTSISLTSYGGAVYNEGTFNMTGGKIDKCIAATYISSSSDYKNEGSLTSLGGAVYNTGIFTMSDGTISSCTATAGVANNVSQKGSLTSLGGAVYNTGIFTMSGGTISSCTATNGGGVYNSKTFKFINGTITGCSATTGGGIYNTSQIYGSSSSATISNCYSTSSKGNGGGVYNATTGTARFYGKITGCYIYFNTSYYGNGGGVYNAGTLYVYSGCQISSCRADGGGGVYNTYKFYMYGTISCYAKNGGGVYVASGEFTMKSSATISSSTAASTNYGGGGLCIIGGSATISGTIKSCSASSSNGGGIFLSGGAVEIYPSGKIGEEDSPNTAKNGGGIYVCGNGTLTMGSDSTTASTNGTVSYNTATNGGGIYATGSSIVTIYGQISNNEATTNGGGVYVIGSATVKYTGIMYYNHADNNGGGLYATSSYINQKYSYPNLVIGGSIGSCSAENGGAIYLRNIFDTTAKTSIGIYVTLSNCTIRNNTATLGNALYCYYCNKIKLTNHISIFGSLYFEDYCYATSSNNPLLFSEDANFDSFGVSVGATLKMSNEEYFVYVGYGQSVDPGFSGGYGQKSGKNEYWYIKSS